MFIIEAERVPRAAALDGRRLCEHVAQRRRGAARAFADVQACVRPGHREMLQVHAEEPQIEGLAQREKEEGRGGEFGKEVED